MILNGKVIILSAPRKIEFEKITINTNKIRPSEIVAKTMFSAISPGTETAAYSGQPALRPGKTYPRLLGYCNVAKVLHIGSAVKNIHPGDLILTGESHRSIIIINQKRVLVKLSKEIDPKEASIIYLYNLGLNALKAVKLKQNSNMAIIGLGILGLGAAEQAKILKFNVSAFSNSLYKLKLAKQLGAKNIFLKRESNNIEKIADVVITTSNSWQDWKLALRLVKNNGKIVVLGFPGRGIGLPNYNPLDSQYFYDKRITIMSVGLPYGLKSEKDISFAIKKNCENILKWITNKNLKPKKLISGVYDYTDISHAYKKLLSRDNKSITYILKW